MKIQCHPTPFLIIGDLPDIGNDSSIELSLDLIAAHPGRWHENWHGQMVNRIAIANSSTGVRRWAEDRHLTCGGYALSEDKTERTPWGAILLCRDLDSLELARQCVRNGIPCVALALPELEVIALDEAQISTWMKGIQDSQDKSESLLSGSMSSTIDRIDAIDSSFVENSGTISVGEPSRTVRRVAG